MSEFSEAEIDEDRFGEDHSEILSKELLADNYKAEVHDTLWF